MTALRADLPPLPRRLRGRPVDRRGYPVPWFVSWHGGEPDFRVIRTAGFYDAVRKRLCWLCGQKLGRMCTINRVSSEPPSHLDCAEFAVKACPFLVRPGAKRREAKMPESKIDPAGHMFEHNPGVSLIWVSRQWSAFSVNEGFLINVGEPVSTSWWREGRDATRAEVMEAMERGVALLLDTAAQEGAASVADMRRQYQDALALVPAA